MKNIFYVLVAISFIIGCSPKDKKDTTDAAAAQLFYNGDILTMDSNEPVYVEAIVAENGKIVFTGNLKEAEEKYNSAQKINLEDKTLLPGFIDPHSHFGMVSNTMGQVDLNPEPVGNITSIVDILASIKKYKADKNIPDGEWIFGWGYDESQLKEKRHPNKKEIDEVLPNNPVYLQHTSGHMVLLILWL